MRDDVDPLSVPSEQARPHLVFLVRADLALEATVYAAEHDAPLALCGLAVGSDDGVWFLVEFADGDVHERGDEVGAGDVEVGEVGAV